jgi:type IX secretion system PorP/SprF family membrane protein
MKKPSVIALLLLLQITLFAQQEPQFNMYMFNKTVINPAAAGIGKAICATGYGRNQWIGYKNDSGMAVNPRTYGLAFDMPVYKIKSGAGLTFQYNQTGAETNTDIKLNYAYHYAIKKKHQVSFGLSLGFLGKSIDYSEVIPSEFDPMLPESKESGFMTDIDLGIHYQAFNKINAGLSVTNLLGSSAEIGAPEFNMSRHLYLYGGYDFTKKYHGHKLVLTPGMLLKATTGALKIDLNAILTYDDLFWGGIVFRVANAAGIMAGINYHGFKAGISYDYTMSSDFTKKSRNSVEFLISYSYTIYPPIVKKSGYNTRNL